MADQVYDFTAKKLNGLVACSKPAVRAALANLRRGIGRKPGELPQIWNILFDEMPEDMYGKGDAPSSAEWAVYTALTLYALHQQSRDIHTDNQNQPNISLGGASARLVKCLDDRERAENRTDNRERIWKRLYAICTADSMQEISYRLRGLIQLLRAEGIALDYPQLAKDLYRYQFSEGAAKVRLGWGQDFYTKQETEKREENLQ